MYVILAIILIVVILVVYIYNGLVSFKNAIKNKEAEIENLKKEGKPESEIAAQAQTHSALIQEYNAKLKTAPSSFIAKYLGFTPLNEDGTPLTPPPAPTQTPASAQPAVKSHSQDLSNPETPEIEEYTPSKSSLPKEPSPEQSNKPPEETLIQTRPQPTKPAESATPNSTNPSEPPSQENPIQQ